MDIVNLKIGMIIKNYKVLCDLLEQPTKTGNARKAQLKEFSRYFDWEKSGQKFIITNIYVTSLTKEDKRKFGNNTGHYRAGDDSYKVSNSLSSKKGVYKIQLNKNVYIGSTTTSFRERYAQHYRNSSGFMSHTHKLLLEGAEYSVLWVAPENISEEEIRNKEQRYISQYMNNDSYHLVNKRRKTVNLNRERRNRNMITGNVSNIPDKYYKQYEQLMN